MSNKEIEKIIERVENIIKDDVTNGKEDKEEYNLLLRAAGRSLLKMANSRCSLHDIGVLTLLAGATFYVGKEDLLESEVLTPLDISEIELDFEHLLLKFVKLDVIKEADDGRHH